MKHLLSLAFLSAYLSSAVAQVNLVSNANMNNAWSYFSTDFRKEYSTFPSREGVAILEGAIIGLYDWQWKDDKTGVGGFTSSNTCAAVIADSVLMCNGATTPDFLTKDVIRTPSITIASSKCYRFGVWMKGNGADVKLVIKKPSTPTGGGKRTGTFVLPAEDKQWKFVSGTFMSEANQTSVILALRSVVETAPGNDFVLDEMSLYAINQYNTYAACGCPNSFSEGSYSIAGPKDAEDRDGDEAQASTDGQDWSITLYPNPARDAIHYAFQWGYEGDYIVSLYDHTGRQVHRSTGIFAPGVETGTIRREEHWPSGLYVASFTSAITGKTLTKAIILE